MHEFSIAVEIGGIIEEHLNGKMENLKKVHLFVGGLSGAIGEVLSLALESVLSSEYNLDSVEIELETEEVIFICNNCGDNKSVIPPLYICSSCGSTNGEVKGSSSIIVKSLEVDDGKV